MNHEVDVCGLCHEAEKIRKIHVSGVDRNELGCQKCCESQRRDCHKSSLTVRHLVPHAPLQALSDRLEIESSLWRRPFCHPPRRSTLPSFLQSCRPQRRVLSSATPLPEQREVGRTLRLSSAE